VTADEQSLEQLRAEAAYPSARLALYRARLFAQRATSPAKLRELERAADGATDRLRRAERDHSQKTSDSSAATDDTIRSESTDGLTREEDDDDGEAQSRNPPP
jgi:hypothetical protein